MTDNMAPDVSEQQNTNFMEQRVLDSQTAYPETHMHLSSKVENEMADGHWSVKNQLMKPVLVRQVQWLSTSARGSNLTEFSFPNVLLKDSLISRTLSMYAFYKMSPVFRIQINATQFNAGQLICSFDPFSFSNGAQPPAPAYDFVSANIFAATGLPHVRIMASESEPVELKIPYIHPRNFLTTDSTTGFNNLGHFRIQILNPLTVPDGSSNSVTVSIWCYAAESDVHVPVAFHTPILEPTSLIGAAAATILPKILESQPVKQATDKIGNIVTSNFGQSINKIGGLTNTLSNLKLDYPSQPLNPEKTIGPVENLAVSIGKSRSQRMAIDPYSMHSPSSEITGEDDSAMDLKKIVSTPFMVTQVAFKTTDAPDSLLFSLPVHPMIQPLIYTLTSPITTYRQPTYLSFVSNAFSYWSGGITFDIEIVATRFHTGKLLFAYSPNSKYNLTSPGITFDEASSYLPNVIVDIQQTSNFTFTIPWTSPTSMKSTFLRSFDPDQSTDVGPPDNDCTNGNLVCFVLNGLNAPTNVAPNIEFNVYAYAASDFNLYVPSKPFFNTYVVPPSLEATSGISITASSNQPHSSQVYLSKDQSLSSPRPQFGESYSLIDIIKRFTFESDNTAKITAGNSSIADPVTPSGVAVSTTITILDYFSRIFSAWSGSIRYKYAFKTNRLSQAAVTAFHAPETDSITLFRRARYYSANELSQFFANVRTHLSQDSALEIEIPYYSKYNMLLTRPSDKIPTPKDYYANGSRVIVVDSPEDFTLNYDLYIAAGDDFKFIYMRPPPLDLFDSKQFFVNKPFYSN